MPKLWYSSSVTKIDKAWEAHLKSIKESHLEPKRPCLLCGSQVWWFRGNEWLCGKCHPKPQDKVSYV